MAMALHPRLGEKSAARDLEQDAMQMVLSILVRSTPPGRLS